MNLYDLYVFKKLKCFNNNAEFNFYCHSNNDKILRMNILLKVHRKAFCNLAPF